MGFLGGLLVGVGVTALLAAGVGAWAWRRFVILDRQAAENRRLAELGTLTGGLAHELKNPLSTIGLNLSLLREELDDAPSKTVSRLERVQGEAARLRVILDDFLRYAGRIEAEPRPLDLTQLLREVADFFAPQAAARGVTLDLDVPEDPALALADETLLKQAVLNLALNAVEHTPPGGRVTLTAGGSSLSVADTGRGIAAEDLPKLFDAYYSRRKGGTGLGLAMVKRIADAHGGRVTVRSTPGRGSTFTLTLPSA